MFGQRAELNLWANRQEVDGIDLCGLFGYGRFQPSGLQAGLLNVRCKGEERRNGYVCSITFVTRTKIGKFPVVERSQMDRITPVTSVR